MTGGERKYTVFNVESRSRRQEPEKQGNAPGYERMVNTTITTFHFCLTSVFFF